jgi:hypothetical protein
VCKSDYCILTPRDKRWFEWIWFLNRVGTLNLCDNNGMKIYEIVQIWVNKMTNDTNEFNVNCRNQFTDARGADIQNNFTHLYQTLNAKLSSYGHFFHITIKWRCLKSVRHECMLSALVSLEFISTTKISHTLKLHLFLITDWKEQQRGFRGNVSYFGRTFLRIIYILI